MMKKKKLHAVTVVLGSILAIAIAFSQFLSAESASTAKKIKTEQRDNNADNETGSCISLPSFSLPAPVHVEVNLNPYCLFEILFEEDIDENHVQEDLFYADRFFETMFRVIISPNAP